MAMLLSNLRETKALLEIDYQQTSEDKKLSLLIESASSWIQNYLNRDLDYQYRTWFYRGTGSQELPLLHRPVFLQLGTAQQLTVLTDDGAYYGSVSGSFNPSLTQLTYGVDYALTIDRQDGGSTCGILVRNNELWQKPFVRQAGWLSPFVGRAFGNIQVNYQAGYTADTLPAEISQACALLVARMRYLLPLGMEIGSESYQERSISLLANRSDYLLSVVKPLLANYRNWAWGGG